LFPSIGFIGGKSLKKIRPCRIKVFLCRREREQTMPFHHRIEHPDSIPMKESVKIRTKLDDPGSNRSGLSGIHPE
jgi:hypothetical protein